MPPTDVRRLSQADRSDRLRIREIRRDRDAPRKAQAAILPNLTGVAATAGKAQRDRAGIGYEGLVAGIPDSEFTSPRELGEILAKTPQCQECVVKQVFRYMAGRRIRRPTGRC